MDFEKTQKDLQKTLTRLKPRHYRTKLLVSLFVLIFVSIGLYSQFFVSLGIFDISPRNPEGKILALNTLPLERLGVNVADLQRDVTQLVASMNNAQQGSHFLLGMISGLMFSQPMAGLTVGVIKEVYDVINNYRADYFGTAYFIDTGVDISFWFFGGLVGFYILSAAYDILRENRIHGPRGLVTFLGKKTWQKVKRKK